jgi:hypothetical protein
MQKFVLVLKCSKRTQNTRSPKMRGLALRSPIAFNPMN